MEKVVQRFASFAEADEATYEYYRSLTPEERLAIMLELSMPENLADATLERSVRIRKLTDPEES